MVLFGGITKQLKLDRVRERLGVQVEWIETASEGTKSTSGLERRVREGRVACVIVLDELIGHKHYDPVVAGARRARVPVGYGGTAGIGSLKKACAAVEAMLAQEA